MGTGLESCFSEEEVTMKQGTILGSQIGKWIILAVVVAAFAALLTASVVRAQEGSTTIDYPENGDGPVATFTATDPEGVTPITWSLLTTGTPGDIVAADYADAADFMIDPKDGVLKFDIDGDQDGSSPGSPDFENPQGAGSPLNNTYNLVVVACDVALTADDTCPTSPEGQAGYHKVTVKVTKVAEMGEVTWTIAPATGVTANDPDDGEMPIMQFQVGAVLTVPADDGVTDGDVSGDDKNVAERLQWYRSPSKTAMGTAIDGETEASYTVTTEDVNMYIRVEAFYNISTTAREETASLTSDYPVLELRTSNDAPEFSSTTVTREVSEGDKGMTVGAPVTATDDISNALNYTLAGTGADNAKFKIDQKTGQITTNVDLDREQEADVDAVGDTPGMFGCRNDYKCVVTVRATDSAGAETGGNADGDPADATVTITLKNVDEKPKLVTGFKMRDVMEGMTQVDDDDDATNDPTGEAIYAATDPDGQSITYSLMGADGAKFQLNAAPRSLSFREKPDYEEPTDRNKDNVYEVTVRASDGVMYADRMVMVKVTPVDEEPEIMGKDSVDYPENGDGPVATFTATDPEGVTPITWSLLTTGTPGDIVAADYADAADFMIDPKDGVLKFDIDGDQDGSSPGSPDFENPQGAGSPLNNTYNVVVVACDVALTADDTCPTSPEGQAGYHKVTVKVTKVAEMGEVTWTIAPATGVTANDPDDGEMPIMQFQVGAVLTASATDGDVSGATKTVTENVTQKWYRGGTAIDGETEASYTVTTEDVNKKLKVEVSYLVDGGREETASLTSDYPVLELRTSNDAPEFSSTTVTREVSEGDKGMTVGAPVTATDDISNALNYTLAGTGADNAKFKIDQKTGQITTNVDLDREQEADVDAVGDTPGMFGCRNDYKCVVTVRATDSAGAETGGNADGDPADATVTITLKNVDEKPKLVTGFKMRDVMEGMTQVDDDDDATNDPTGEAIYAATDPDGLNVNLTLMGPDGAKFQLTSGTNGSALSFREKPDYEEPTDRNRDNVYEVTVRASDGTMYADRMVKVTVTDANEAPMILPPGVRVSGPSSLNYEEKGTDAVGTYTATGSQAASARWTMEGDDAGDFRLDGSGMSRMLKFRSSPDYEMPMDADTDNTYMVTVKASYGSGAEMGMDTQTVTVYVTNVEEDGTVILSSMTPVVDTPLTANLTDLDEVMPDSVMWQWSRTKDGNVMDIGGATMMSYTPVAEDGGYYLRATATYTDGYGDDTAMATTASKVVGNRAPVFATDMTTRTIAENTAAGMNIGAPVAATDPDGDTLTYSLSGTDEASFDIGESTGQLMTKAALDYETKMSYMVTVTATDPDDAADTIEVTINVTEVDEGPVQRYDGNDDGEIDIGELFNAIDDYFDEGLSISDLFEVIDAYFAG